MYIYICVEGEKSWDIIQLIVYKKGKEVRREAAGRKEKAREARKAGGRRRFRDEEKAGPLYRRECSPPGCG